MNWHEVLIPLGLIAGYILGLRHGRRIEAKRYMATVPTLFPHKRFTTTEQPAVNAARTPIPEADL